MTILGIESSCDETSASLIKSTGEKLEVISNVTASSLPLHATTGGIVPENAAREQIKYIIPVLKEALVSDFDAIAVTVGPGLIGSLLVGVETAKTLSYVFKKRIIPVNHLIGHIYANWLENKNIEFPALSLIVSGGHTDLFIIENHKKIKWVGGTKDDAAGEAFDKIGRLLNLPYPGGPEIEKAGKDIKFDNYNFPRPIINSQDFDFSFSGLKTAVLREVQGKKLSNVQIQEISFSVQKAVVDVLVTKTLKAAKELKVKSILLGGGVAANQMLRDDLKNKSGQELFIPPKSLCTDNAAMIAAAAFYNGEPINWDKISANPQLSFA
ncbi:MAG TPA: tRNA (adenosine(37)-N6)-threonylcarbamoyltransferase complex transferase subunit TsaD [Patescibacteria group bacterium]|nr:tRNA (adenosine(37)-N6)-threonylcarbamoyltransferase complex transferase subunit TsaD [Patescibacteria group bacterium]